MPFLALLFLCFVYPRHSFAIRVVSPPRLSLAYLIFAHLFLCITVPYVVFLRHSFAFPIIAKPLRNPAMRFLCSTCPFDAVPLLICSYRGATLRFLCCSLPHPAIPLQLSARHVFSLLFQAFADQFNPTPLLF